MVDTAVPPACREMLAPPSLASYSQAQLLVSALLPHCDIEAGHMDRIRHVVDGTWHAVFVCSFGGTCYSCVVIRTRLVPLRRLMLRRCGCSCFTQSPCIDAQGSSYAQACTCVLVACKRLRCSASRTSGRLTFLMLGRWWVNDASLPFGCICILAAARLAFSGHRHGSQAHRCLHIGLLRKAADIAVAREGGNLRCDFLLLDDSASVSMVVKASRKVQWYRRSAR